jgi:exonuclease SbcD
MVRIAHLADTHLGYKQYNLEEREKDIYDVLEEIGDKIREEHVDIVIHSGDLFDSPRPTTQAFYVFKKFLKRFGGKAEFFAVLGDHDKPKIRSMPPHMLFDDQIQTLGISGTAQHQKIEVNGEKVVVAGISNLSKNYRPLLVEELKKLEVLRKDCDCSILALHEGIDKFFIEEMCELALTELPKNFKYYAMGHLHTRIKASHGQGELAYPGSSEIINSQEIAGWQRAGKGFNIVDISADDVQITEVNLERIRPQIQVKLNFAHFSDELSAFVRSLGSNEKLPVVHVFVEGKEVDRQGVLEALDEALTGKVLTFRHRIDDVSQMRLPELKPGAFNINQVLGDYLKDKEIAELAADLLRYFRQGDSEGAKDVANEYFERVSKGVKAHFTEQSQAE